MPVCVFDLFFDPLPIKLFKIEQEKKGFTSSITYPYPKGEHMGAVGTQICEFL